MPFFLAHLRPVRPCREMMTRQLPFLDINPMMIPIVVLQHNQRPPIPDSPAVLVPPAYVALMRQCWQACGKVGTEARGEVSEASNKAFFHYLPRLDGPQRPTFDGRCP